MDKILDNKMRRKAKRQGLVLVKSRTRDRDANNYGLFALVPEGTEATRDDIKYTIDEVEKRLTRQHPLSDIRHVVTYEEKTG